MQAIFSEENDFEASLRRLRGSNTDICQEATEIKVLEYISSTVFFLGSSTFSFTKLKFKK